MVFHTRCSDRTTREGAGRRGCRFRRSCAMYAADPPAMSNMPLVMANNGTGRRDEGGGAAGDEGEGGGNDGEEGNGGEEEEGGGGGGGGLRTRAHADWCEYAPRTPSDTRRYCSPTQSVKSERGTQR